MPNSQSGEKQEAVKAPAAKPDPDLVTVGSLVFRPNQLVRVELTSSDIAADEAKYADVLKQFLARAQSEREKINVQSDKLQVGTFLRFLRLLRPLSKSQTIILIAQGRPEVL